MRQNTVPEALVAASTALLAALGSKSLQEDISQGSWRSRGCPLELVCRDQHGPKGAPKSFGRGLRCALCKKGCF